MRRLIGVALLSLWLVAVTGSVVRAQAEPAGYRPAIELALTEYRDGNFEEARAEFRRAHALFPNARALRGIGMAEFELRNYGECIQALQEALSSQVRPLEGDLRVETESLLAKALHYVARVAFDIQPEAVTVLIDGAVVTLDASKSLMVRVGTHDLEVRAEGYETQRRELRVVSGQDQTLQLTLNDAAPVADVPSTPDVASSQVAVSASTSNAAEASTTNKPNLLPWIIVGGSAAVSIVGIVLVAMAQSDIATVEDAKDGTTWPKLEGAYDSAPLKSGIGITMIGLGLAGVTTGVLMLVLNKNASAYHNTAQVAVGLGSIAVTGAF
jgi:hypothetical protein